MKKEWNEVIITRVGLAVYVRPDTGAVVHKNRPLHGLVLNDREAVKDYCFSDGRVLHTEGESLFYLPKGSSYSLKNLQSGGCFAINFDADIEDEPFVVTPNDAEVLKKRFKTACEKWKRHNLSGGTAAMRALYEAIYQMCKMREREYMPTERQDAIRPAIEEIDRRFTDGELTVAHLAKLCEMSEVYFRRIFLYRFRVSPKEYIIRKRIEYAKNLLSCGEFEVSEVATVCGYAEPCHFSREFKKRVGVSPKEYR